MKNMKKLDSQTCDNDFEGKTQQNYRFFEVKILCFFKSIKEAFIREKQRFFNLR